MNLNSSTTLDMEESAKSQKKKSEMARRPDIDVIIIALTWGIFLFHACLVYSPFSGYYVDFPEQLDTGPIKESEYHIISAGYIIDIFITFMHAWNMPMFFYLSGLNAYFALFRRTETQFRDERVHRLLVPALFFDLVTQLPMTLAYFAPNNAFTDILHFTYLDTLQWSY